MKDENGGKQMKTVWRFPAAGRDEKKFGKHPTQKPTALIGRCLRASTNPGDLVFDPFAGSASTGVAALSLNRKFLGCDVELEYADLASRRLAATASKGPVADIPQSVALDGQQRFLEVAGAYHTAAD